MITLKNVQNFTNLLSQSAPRYTETLTLTKNSIELIFEILLVDTITHNLTGLDFRIYIISSTMHLNCRSSSTFGQCHTSVYGKILVS